MLDEPEPTDIALWKLHELPKKTPFPSNNPVMMIYTFTIYRPLEFVAPPATESSEESQNPDQRRLQGELDEPIGNPLDIKVGTTVIIHNGFRVFNEKPEDSEDGKVEVVKKSGDEIKIEILDNARILLPALSALAFAACSLYC